MLDGDTVVSVGPVDRGAARTWIEHEMRNLAVVRVHVDELPFAVPSDVIDEIAGYLGEWRAVLVASDGPFRWSTVLSRQRLTFLVRYWANLDLLTDAQVRRLGLTWAPLSTRPFFDALVAAVDRALRAGDGESDPFARLLAR